MTVFGNISARRSEYYLCYVNTMIAHIDVGSITILIIEKTKNRIMMDNINLKESKRKQKDRKDKKENKTKQNKTKQNKTKQNKTKQNKTKQNKIKTN